MSHQRLLKNPDLFKSQCYINGEWLSTKEQIAVINPATQEVLGSVPNLSTEKTLSAVEAAHQAFKSWKKCSAKVRHRILRRWFELIMQNQEDLALLLTLEQGKPLAEACSEIAYGAAYIEWFAEEAKRIYGDTIPALNANSQIIVQKQPIGVCAAITPWNFPHAMITRKAAPALAAGCSFIIRPASQTPFSALALAALAEQAGIPKGVFNVITGHPQPIGKVLTEDDRVKKLSFTGSTQIGRELMKQSASTIKKLSLELGGNAPFIVFNDADLEQAVQGVLISKFRNAGQTCVCANRIYVQAGIYEQFIAKFKVQVEKLSIGDGTDPQNQVGPLIDQNALEKVQEYLTDALANGGEILCGGNHLGGLFFEPTIIINATDQMRFAKEEIFGPIAPIFKFDTVDEVIQRANDTEFGLASYFYSQNLNTVMTVADELEYGIVGINTGIISNEAAPFGGVKQSGLGREGSKYGIEDYLEIKYLSLNY
ncbi:NAD-dependent succinate-semialdehyde dehydrogenase [Glaesserella sp.]|uniref:NAD-dependent succinate-semialdehyde dehydrogenase n=1 Tax=Glaesserella sp. TaxID=2094731 RepID=UPI00359FF5E4